MGTKRPTTDEADRHLLADIAGAKVDDGGPAFPTTTFQRVGELEEGVSTGGMTLRDYFAAKAMAKVDFDEMFSKHWTSKEQAEFDGDNIKRSCNRAYAIADAMLAARNGGAS